MVVIDTEVYKNYFLLSAKQERTGKVVHFEMYNGKDLDIKPIAHLMRNNTTVSFNGISYDLPMITAALQSWDCEALKRLSDRLITSGLSHWKICREEGLDVPSNWDHIDLINVAPGKSSLKIYGGRLSAPCLQDLPIGPDQSIPPDLRPKMRAYCENDLDTTLLLYNQLKKAIDLRVAMSEQYGMDLRSKSDAQIAETVIVSELQSLTGKDYRAPKLPKDYKFRYKDPGVISFKSAELRETFDKLMGETFGLSANGSVAMPKWIRETRISIGDGQYQMGIGGLHSNESSQHIEIKDDECLSEFDVASYYPAIILQQGLFPPAMGRDFLTVYNSIVERRLAAKKRVAEIRAELSALGGGQSEEVKDRVEQLQSELVYQNTISDTLKISANGSFGKTGSKYSALYAPELLIQITVTGQLALLMLIERFEDAGVKVVSANTDGVVVHYNKSLQSEVDRVTWEWMLDTSYMLEETPYRSLSSRDVNNYVAVRQDGAIKGKGCFATGGLMKNPDRQIVYEAVAEQIANGTPIAKTITECRDILRFCTLRQVNGGARWRGKELGRAVRFYASTSVASDECIEYVKNGNRVPKSAGTKPLMTLPEAFPDDVDYQVYLVEAEKLLCEVGYL